MYEDRRVDIHTSSGELALPRSIVRGGTEDPRINIRTNLLHIQITIPMPM